MSKLLGILFDKDGTLLDFEATWGPATAAVISALADGDEARVARMSEACGFDHARRVFAPSSPIIAGDTDAFAPFWAELLAASYDLAFAERVNGLYRRESLASLTGYDDVAPVLDALKTAGLSIGLATNDSETTARAHLQALGIADRFAFVSGYDSGYGGKPAPGMIHAFADCIGARCDQVAMVGDSAHDMAAARAAGARAIGIARTPAALAALEGLADLTIVGLGELPAHLKAPPAA